MAPRRGEKRGGTQEEMSTERIRDEGGRFSVGYGTNYQRRNTNYQRRKSVVFGSGAQFPDGEKVTSAASGERIFPEHL